MLQPRKPSRGSHHASMQEKRAAGQAARLTWDETVTVREKQSLGESRGAAAPEKGTAAAPREFASGLAKMVKATGGCLYVPAACLNVNGVVMPLTGTWSETLVMR